MRSKDVAGGRRDRIVWWRQCVKSQYVAGGRRGRGLYGGGNVSGARVWLDVGETDDCMAESVCKYKGCGWREERQRIV